MAPDNRVSLTDAEVAELRSLLYMVTSNPDQWEDVTEIDVLVKVGIKLDKRAFRSVSVNAD